MKTEKVKVKLPKNKTKIICTIGPASRSEKVLRDLIRNGMNVARVNFAHEGIEEHRRNIERIRGVAQELNRLVAILADLPGPKIRIGKLKGEPISLKKGNNVTLTIEDISGTPFLIPVEYKKLPKIVSKGDLIYLNDGFIQLRVQELKREEVECKVIIGGELLSHKGLNLPGKRILTDAVTERDLKCVEFGLEENVDAFGISFVEGGDDIIRVKEFASKKGKQAFTVAKIERAVAVKNIDEILSVADAIMIARGDLGVETRIENLPMIQKNLIHKANRFCKPVITATQMLESMTYNIRPTRAEATDVANAILDGTDAVMLSEETAVGKYPAEAVKMIRNIAIATERQRKSPEQLKETIEGERATIEDVISLDVVEALRTLKIKFVLTPTHSGSTPRRISRFKPECWILSFSRHEKVVKSLVFSYGIYPFLMEGGALLHERIIEFAKSSGLVKPGDKVILTEGITPGRVGGTNSLKIVTVD